MNKRLIVSVFVLLVAITGAYLIVSPAEAPSTVLGTDSTQVIGGCILGNVDSSGNIKIDESGFNPDVECITREVNSYEAVLLDVRTAEERVEDGYVAISTHYDVQKLRDGLTPKLDPNTKIYVHCKSGKRAGEAIEILKAKGYKDVTNIGGLVDWENAGGEVVR